MSDKLPANTRENEELTRELERLRIEFTILYTRHKDMVENESAILTSLYLEKLGHLQLELLQKQTESARLKMKMKLIQAALNRDESPNLSAIEEELNIRLKQYYAQIEAQSAALDEAKNVLSHLISEEDSQKLKEIFRVLCKRLHPDLNPNQSEAEKDLFIKVKAAYDLQRLTDLQNILLYLEDSDMEKLVLVSMGEKADRIAHLEKNMMALREKISQLKQSFPFNIAELLEDADYISQKQDEIKTQIKSFEEEILNYLNIISLLTDE